MPLRTPTTIPDNRVLGENEAGPRVIFFLRATPPVFTVLLQGHSNHQRLVRAVVQAPSVGLPSSRLYPARRAGIIQASGLVHARTLGSPLVSPSFSVASLVHARGLGDLVVSTTTPPDPPDPPDPDPDGPIITLSGGPRTILSTQRRGTKSRR